MKSKTSSQSSAKAQNNEPIKVPKVNENQRYLQITKELKQKHAELLKLQTEGKLSEAKDSPLISDYMMTMRLNCSLLFNFINGYLDVLTDLSTELASKRQKLYVECIDKKMSPSASDTHIKQMTREDEAIVKAVEYQIQQVKNDYERFNSICMALQSSLKEKNTERIVG